MTKEQEQKIEQLEQEQRRIADEPAELRKPKPEKWEPKSGEWFIDCVFETNVAAKDAAIILNRDGVKPPHWEGD